MIVLLLINVVVGLVRGENVLGCASKTLDISCPVGEVLVFESAFYGRDDKTTCLPTGEDTKTDTSLCQMSSVVHLLNKECFRKATCSVQPEKILQPDPCPNTAKYLRTKYSCTLEHHIHTLCTSYYVHRRSGYLISPNYPRNYNANTKCTSEIQTEESDSQTHLNLLDINMEARTKSKGCFDWLIVHDRSSPSEANIYCGSLDTIKTPTSFTLNNAILKFKSDPKNNLRGFLIKFEVLNPNLGASVNHEDSGTDEQIEQLKNQLAQLEERKNIRMKQQNMNGEIKTDTSRDTNKNKDDINKHQSERNVEIMKDKNKHEQSIGDLEQVAKPGVKQWNSLKGGPIIAKECSRESLVLPEHSYIVSYREGKKLQIECVKGFKLDDEDNGLLVCHENKWAGQIGLCLPQKCQVPQSPAHGEVIYRKLAVGHEAQYICHKDYVLVGENSMTCMNDGQWSGFPPKCLESGSRSLSVKGELLVAVLLTLLFIFFKKRILKITGGVYINIGDLGKTFTEKLKEAD